MDEGTVVWGKRKAHEVISIVWQWEYWCVEWTVKKKSSQVEDQFDHEQELRYRVENDIYLFIYFFNSCLILSASLKT